MPPEGSRMAGLWEREVGRLPPKLFANAVKASEDLLRSLSIHKRLRSHQGYVDTLSFNADGSLLMSGSHDGAVVLWNWEEAEPTLTFHIDSVLHAQFMPFSDDRSIITCSDNGEVKHVQIKEGGHLCIQSLVELEYTVRRLAAEPGNPHTFFSCGGDGSVWRFDLRGKYAMELFKCEAVDHFAFQNIILYAIAIDPRNPHTLAVAGSDEYARLYDTRKICLNGNSTFSHPTEYFCPPHLIGANKDGITGLAFSHTSELLASYSCDDIYLFFREHGLHFNNIEVGEQLLIDESREACHIKTAPLPFCKDKLPTPQAFKGCQNKDTIKGVNFLGPNCDYVTSGSDSGFVFIWRKKDGHLVHFTRGDKRLVNCIEQHPFEIVVASSGIESDIKIWAPSESESESESEGPCRFHIGEFETGPISSSSGSDFALSLLDWHSFHEDGRYGYEEEEANEDEDKDDEDDDESEDIDGAGFKGCCWCWFPGS